MRLFLQVQILAWHRIDEISNTETKKLNFIINLILIYIKKFIVKAVKFEESSADIRRLVKGRQICRYQTRLLPILNSILGVGL